MRKILTPALAALAILLTASCSQKYSLELPLALSRIELRFDKAETSSYFMVYSTFHWTIDIQEEGDWYKLSRTEGDGNGQVSVSVSENMGVSRGVALIVKDESGRSVEIYVSQKSGLSEGGNYGLALENLNILNAAAQVTLTAGTNLSDYAIKSATASVKYEPEGQEWLQDIVASKTDVNFNVLANSTGESRKATVTLTFPTARWDTQVTAIFYVTQAPGGPEISLFDSYVLDPMGNVATPIAFRINWDTNFVTYDCSHFSFSDDSWIKSASYDPATFTLSVTPYINRTASARQTTLSCEVRDADGIVISTATTRLTQEIGNGENVGGGGSGEVPVDPTVDF